MLDKRPVGKPLAEKIKRVEQRACRRRANHVARPGKCAAGIDA